MLFFLFSTIFITSAHAQTIGSDGYVDHVRVTVYYTEAAEVPVFSWWSAGIIGTGMAFTTNRKHKHTHRHGK